MKVYERNEYANFAYPDDMKRILDYLNIHGKILVKPSIVESLYYDFSDERYCASRLYVDEQILEEFEEWLTEKDI